MQVLRTKEFSRWLHGLRDREGRVRIERRLDRVEETGHLGVTRSVGGGVHEMKLDFGPGYRLYYAFHETKVIYLLAGGDKDSQSDDIGRSAEMLKTIGEVKWNLD